MTTAVVGELDQTSYFNDFLTIETWFTGLDRNVR